MQRVFPAFNEEEAFVTGRLGGEECRSLAEGLRQVVLQVEALGEERRLTLLDGQPPAQRRSGRRPQIRILSSSGRQSEPDIPDRAEAGRFLAFPAPPDAPHSVVVRHGHAAGRQCHRGEAVP